MTHQPISSKHPSVTRRRKGAKPSAHTFPASFASLREAMKKRALFSYAAVQGRTVAMLMMFIAGLHAGCTSKPTGSNHPTPIEITRKVTATSYPLACFAKRLVDDSIEVLTLCPEAGSIDSWRPSREQILSMQQSDIIFVNGSAAPFAKWLPLVTLPDSKVCQTANDGLDLADMIAVKDIRIVHSHGPEGEHSHPTMVAYTWLDPAMAAKQTAIMAEQLSSIYPDLRPLINDKKTELDRELNLLSKILAELGNGSEDQLNVLTGTPDLKFLTRAAGINDVHLNWSKPPTAIEAKTQLQAKVSSLTPIPTFMLFASEPSPEVQNAVEFSGLKIGILNPIAQPPAEGDYFSVMRENLNRLRSVFGNQQNKAQSSIVDPEQN